MGFLKEDWLSIIFEVLLLLYLMLAFKSSGKKISGREDRCEMGEIGTQENTEGCAGNLVAVCLPPALPLQWCGCGWELKERAAGWTTASQSEAANQQQHVWAAKCCVLHHPSDLKEGMATSFLPSDLCKMHLMSHVSLELCKKGDSGKCSFKLS